MKIEIRPYQDSDIPFFYEAVKESLPALSVWLPWAHEHYSLQETEIWIRDLVPDIWKEQKGCEFVIGAAESNQVLGGCCLEQVDLKKSKPILAIGFELQPQEKGLLPRHVFSSCNTVLQNWAWKKFASFLQQRIQPVSK